MENKSLDQCTDTQPGMSSGQWETFVGRLSGIVALLQLVFLWTASGDVIFSLKIAAVTFVLWLFALAADSATNNEDLKE